MKYYLDEDLSPKIAAILRGQGIDAVSSHECGRNGLDDERQLALAGTDGRCFVTRNRNDFIALTVRFFESGEAHAGVLIVSGAQAWKAGRVASALAGYARKHPEGMQPYTIDFLQ